MRIISGKLGGQAFDAPHTSVTHPMSEKIRGGIFNTLGDIEGLHVLDAYAGSGAVGFEAFSRGAKSVTIVEEDRKAVQTIKKNIQNLELFSHVDLLPMSIEAWLAHTSRTSYDVVIADPPYDRINPQTLDALYFRTKDKGIFVLSYPCSYDAPIINNHEAIRVKSYGDACVAYYRVESET
jgi:16S rRNA (guanine966-N2)-methyltransferase